MVIEIPLPSHVVLQIRLPVQIVPLSQAKEFFVQSELAQEVLKAHR